MHGFDVDFNRVVFWIMIHIRYMSLETSYLTAKDKVSAGVNCVTEVCF
jgi:hypothetical protein